MMLRLTFCLDEEEDEEEEEELFDWRLGALTLELFS